MALTPEYQPNGADRFCPSARAVGAARLVTGADCQEGIGDHKQILSEPVSVYLRKQLVRAKGLCVNTPTGERCIATSGRPADLPHTR